jgi:hypothetical protein
MRAVIYLVSGVACSVLLWPPQLLCTLNPACPAPVLPAAALAMPNANPDLLGTALLRGTNRVATDTLLQSGLAPDVLLTGADLDEDGDADEFHLRLEVAALGDAAAGPLLFVPRTWGHWQWQPPADTTPLTSPTLQLEQGDRLLITLENPLAVPLELQVDGVQATPVDAAGVLIAHEPVPPGGAQTYRVELPEPGEARYLAADAALAQRGLQGVLQVAPNAPARQMPLLTPEWSLITAATPVVDTRVEDPMSADEVLQLSAFGLALGLALAGLAGLPWPRRRRRRTAGASA